LAIEKKKLTIIIDFLIKIGLFEENERGFFSKRILQHLDYREQLRESGRKGGRGNKKPPFSDPKASLEPPFSDPKASLKPPHKQDRIEEDRIEEENKRLKEKFEFSFEFLNNDPLRILFDEWFKFKQNSKDKFDNQASIEASFKMLQNYSKNNIVKATELVNAAIAANAKNLFNIESKPEPIVIPKHHMPR